MTNDLIKSLFFNPKEELKVYKQENDLTDLAITEGVNKGLQIALIHLRKLNADILWKQLNMNINEND
mgnify:CR=1 FL=1